MATSEDRSTETSGSAASASTGKEPGLDAYTAWRCVLQLRVEAVKQPVLLGLKSTGLDVQLGDERAWHFDLEGRLLKIATPNVHWRRGLSGRCVQLRKRAREESGGLESRLLDAPATDRHAPR